MLVFAHYKKTVIFQIFSDQDSTFEITEPDFSHIRLYENNCDIPLFLQIDNSLKSLTQTCFI